MAKKANWQKQPSVAKASMKLGKVEYKSKAGSKNDCCPKISKLD